MILHLLEHLKFNYINTKNDHDSLLIISKGLKSIKFNNGVNKIKLDCSSNDSSTYFSAMYYQVLKRTGSIAPGNYKTIVSVTDTYNNSKCQINFYQKIDSVLTAGSPLRKDINKILSPKSFRAKYNYLEKFKAYSSGLAMTNCEKKINKKAKARGLTAFSYKINNKSYVNYYYENWFAGKYEVVDKKPLQKQLLQQYRIEDAESPAELADNDLETPSSLGSQYKKIKKQKDDKQETKGQVALSITAANGQEQYSNIDNNYYELSGQVEIPFKNLPVELEGFYSSQDRHRAIKSSYFRVHYDVEKVKAELAKFITSYNQKFAETESKLIGMQQMYGGGISSLEGQRTVLMNEVASETKRLDDVAPKPNVKADLSSYSEGAPVNEMKEKTSAEKAILEEKREKIEVLSQKIDKYKRLLDQFSNTRYFDSAINYSKTRNLNYENLSYKEMVKKSSDLLPDGSAKKFVNGISSLDAGMFPKYASKYTMSGQMMKGLDFSYDLGFAEIGATAGKTEYIGRDGSLDKYTCYSTKASFKMLSSQKISILYYGYSPEKSIFSGTGFYKSISISTPTFIKPVHIVSTNYDGIISKSITVNAEVATSIYTAQLKEGAVDLPKTGDKMAYHLAADGGVPNTKVQVEIGYDKTGKSFVNNTLPLTLNGTEQYRLMCSNDFFRSLLSVAVEYNYLLQNNFASQAGSTKWGFDIKTHSKRYPNLGISYKPFATFHTYGDTMNIPTHPLLGSILMGKASYQFKQQRGAWRFSAIYNRCITTMDTIATGNTLMQLTCIYSEKTFSASANAGMMKQYGTNNGVLQTSPNDMNFLGISANYKVDKNVSLSIGQDIGVAVFGLCKYSANGGVQVEFKKLPVAARMSFRFSTYQLTIQDTWRQLYSGNMEIIYRFKLKHNNNN